MTFNNDNSQINLQEKNNKKTFGFPFTPWPLQIQFMERLYETLTLGGIGILESPTGTGKSLSLICGSLSWLNDKRKSGELLIEDQQFQEKDGKENADTSVLETNVVEESVYDDEPDWIKEYETTAKEQKRNEILASLQQKRIKLFDKIEAERNKMVHLKQMKESKRQKRYKSSTSSKSRIINTNEDSFLLDDLDKRRQEISKILKEIEMEGKRKGIDDHSEKYRETKIIYTSRTHSQISQFVKEIRKTKFSENTTIVSLGSRKQLCIHEKVQALQNVLLMNDACLDLQKGPSDNRCPYLATEEEKSESFYLGVFSEIHDIEDIALIGSEKDVCPYYGSRKATEEADIITLPYNLLFSKSSREALQLDISGHVVIIDEAHNVIDVINSLHSATFSLSQMKHTNAQLKSYFQKYEKRLAPRNVTNLKQIMRFLSSCQKYLEECQAKNSIGTIGSMNDLFHAINVDNLNLFHLQKYLQESKLAKKLQGFTELQEYKRSIKLQISRQKGPIVKKNVSFLHSKVYIQQLQNFLLCLTNPDVDGKLYVEKQDDGIALSFMLLNPASVFEDIVKKAKAVIMVGGTMEPLSELKHQLIPNIPESQFHHLSCGHIVPPTSINVIALSEGPSRKLNFSYSHRNDKEIITELGNIVSNYCNLIPGGVIVFFPSYSYMELVYQQWMVQGTIERFKKKKDVYLEPKQNNLVEATLLSYANSIDECKKMKNQMKIGAMMFCVVGGKLSEGINFSDDLGRGVIVVGLPFANLYSAEIQEKMKYYNDKFHDTNAGNEYYENMCMKSVNQSIGRAIRHKNDYACIILLDERYHSKRIYDKLPGWIKKSQVQNLSKFGQSIQSISKFFKFITESRS